MKAILVRKYGGPEVAQLSEVEKPNITKPDEILVKVMASSVNSGDARIRRADPWMVRLAFGLFAPRRPILGMAFSGVVESVGSDVTKYKPGDRVYGMNENLMSCHAEFVIVNKQTRMSKMPASMSFEDAAALPFGGTTALHFLSGLDLEGKSVLINGASGAVGLTFLQLAKARGAKVTGVSSTTNLPLLRELGAENVIDYTATDVTTLPTEYDVVIDCVNKIPVHLTEKLVKSSGVIILLAGLIKEMFQSRKIKKAKVLIGPAKVTNEQIDELSKLYESRQLKAVIHKVLPLSDIAEAYALVDGGRKVGNVVMKIGE